MEEWKKYKVADVIEEISMGPFGSNIKVSNFIDTGVPVLNGSNLQGFKLNEDSFNYVSDEKADSLGRANAFRGDIVITHRGTLGQIVYIPDNSRHQRYVISQSQFRLKLNPKLARPDFFTYYFHTREGQHKILMNASQVGVPALARPTSTFKEVAISLPKIEEQTKIMAILHSLDDKIVVNKKICENLEAQAQALFKHWFVDFAPFKDGKFVESELGLIPEGWRVGKAEDFYTINIGKTPPRAERQWFSESKGNNKIWISISDMGSCGTFISDSKEYLTPETQSKFNIVMVPAGTILLSFKLTIGRVAIADNELTTNEAIARFILPNSDYREFTYLYLKQYKYGSLGSTSSIATAVNSKIIKSMPFLMPSTEVMAEFSTVVSKLFDEIRILSIESLRLSTLRDTLLPKLMSGQIKV